MIEIGVADPLRVTEGKPTRCSGEMDVDISFEVSAKSMNGKKDTREKALFARPVFNDICSDGGNKVHEVTVQPKKTQSSEGIVKVICCQVVLGRVFRLFLIQMSVAFLPQEGQNLDLQL